VKAAREDGQPSLASTDHGNLWGLIEFYKTCKENEVNPILGIEAYFCDDQKERGGKSGHGHIDGSDKRYYHLTVLAENNTGYQNLIKLSSDAFLEGFYYAARTDWSKLEQFSDGLIVTTGCLGGPVLQELLHDNFNAALQKTARLQDIFGRDNLFVELQDHGLVEQAKTNPMLIDIARKLNAPLLATNDLHYVKHEDWIAHDSLLCCQTGARRSDEKRFKFQSDQHYLKSAAEMRALFATIPEACDNTLWVAERCNVELEVAPYAKPLHLPVFAVPSGFEDATQYLAHLAFAGLRERYGDPTEEQVERLVYELQVLDTLGLSAYMLIVWDLVKFADREGIRRGAARGSVAGSLCAYCLDISKVDPLRHKLLFERFLNPDRVAMPDIDLDFDTRYRDRMLEYTRSKYGEDQVAQIITFSKIGARTAVRDSARVLGYDAQLANEISKAMPDLVMGEATPLKYCFEESPRYETGYKNAEGLRNLHAANPQVREVVDVALGLEGLVRQDGVHAAGVLITPGPLTDYVPIQKKPDGPITTQYEKNALEDLGLVKMDFLGLRNLDVISKTLDLLGFDPGVEDTAFNDPKTFTLLRRGNTIGVFQLEGKGMRTLLQRLKPTSIDDIAAVVALYRPGPMGSDMHVAYADRKNGREPVSFFHQDAEDVLGPTYGLCVYQEQLVKLAQRFAGYSPSAGDSLRKLVGKKLIDKMSAEKDVFIQGCVDQGYSSELGASLFKMIAKFASYGFNQCLTGDTVIGIGGHNLRRTQWTLEEIYNRVHDVLPPTPSGRYKGPKYTGPCIRCGRVVGKRRDGRSRLTRGLCAGCNAWRAKFTRGEFRVLALDSDGRIRPKPVKAIHRNGVQDVYRVILDNGSHIDSTLNHRHMMADGRWREVGQLSVGDSLMIHAGVDSRTGMSLDDNRVTKGERQNKGKVRHAFGSDNYGYIDGGHIEWKRNSAKLPQHCENDASHTGRLEIAHLDGNRRNNDLSNLRRLCTSCHKKHDYRNNSRRKTWEKGHLAGTATITKIERLGQRMTYDLEMATKEHCFVANGVVTHNSHAYGYGYISYQTAYLKANYPKEYMAALCSSLTDDIEKCAVMIAEARRMGLEIHNPDINKSLAEFSAEEDGLRVGLSAVRYVGFDAAEKIVSQRPYGSLMDFVLKNNPNARAFESLALAGAFSDFGTRLGVSSVIPEVLKAARKKAKKVPAEQMSLLDEDALWAFDLPQQEFPPEALFEKEFDALGLYVSGHPLDAYTDQATDWTVADLEHAQQKQTCELLVQIVGVKRRRTVNGDDMAILQVQDQTGTVEIVCFPKAFARTGNLLEEDAIGLLKVRAGMDRMGGQNYILEEFSQLGSAIPEDVDMSDFKLFLPKGFINDEAYISKLKGLFLSHHGNLKASLYVSRNTRVELPVEFAVDGSEALMEDLKRLFVEFASR